MLIDVRTCGSVLQCVEVCCSVLQDMHTIAHSLSSATAMSHVSLTNKSYPTQECVMSQVTMRHVSHRNVPGFT